MYVQGDRQFCCMLNGPPFVSDVDVTRSVDVMLQNVVESPELEAIDRMSSSTSPRPPIHLRRDIDGTDCCQY